MDRSDRLSRTASIACTKGLRNDPGENNCFLNSAVQVLWHLDVFRRSFRELSGHFCVGQSCIFCALKVIFTQIQYSDEVSLPPDALRQALAVTFKDQHRFQLHDMDDAAECLENILSRLHFHFAMNEKDEICNAAHCISHRKFAMEIMEQTICKCGATSEPLPFFQLVHYVSVTALCHEAEFLSTKLKGLNEDVFGQLLKRAVNHGDMRDCPGNCGQRINVQQSLLNSPDVVSIGLIWDSDNPDIEQITQLMHCIDPVLRLPEVFPRVSDDKAKKVELLLSGVVTYYGKHYSTFFYNNKMKTWIYFDDARVRKCGPDWEKIRDKCCKNHYQPLLLLYVNPHGKPVSTKTAPSEVNVVDSTTLLVSGENTRGPRAIYSSEKTKDMFGGTMLTIPESNRKTKMQDSNVLESSSSSHSLGSGGSSEKGLDVSAPGQKKSRRPMKKLKTVGSGIKKALSRSRNNSPTTELQSNSLHTLNSEKVEAPKKSNSHDDLIDLSVDPRSKSIMSLYETSSRGREGDETDSGLGSSSSQASSPATSSVSSVDTNTDDLIDFSSKTFPRAVRGNDNHRVDNIVEEAEGLLRSSYELEKAGDLALSLSMSTNASTRFRIVIEKYTTVLNPSFLAKLKNKYSMCVERSRDLHQRITAEKEASNPQFSRQQTQVLLTRQKERDQQVLRQHKQVPTMNGTLPRSSNKDRDSGVVMNGVVPATSRSINELYLKNDHSSEANSSSSDRRPVSRSHYPGSVGTSRTPPDYHDNLDCSQKIKPDSLCYSPIHYGKANGLSGDLERMKIGKQDSARDRKSTVTHVSTSFVPMKSLPIEHTLLSSTAYLTPNSRTSLNDARRCSIYDNLPPSDEPRRPSSAVPMRSSMSSSHPTKSFRFSRQEDEGHRKSFNAPAYVDPPPYDPSRTFLNATSPMKQPELLFQRFNVPPASWTSETVGLPDDIRRVNDEVRAARRLCQKCRGTFVEKNANLCAPCCALDSMLNNLHDNTAVLY